MNKFKIILLPVVFFLITFATSQAQTTFSPDRPGLGDGTYVLQPGNLYLEIGAEYYNAEITNVYSLGQVMLRYGLLKNVELRVALNSFVVESYGSGSNTGLEGPGLGVKFNLLQDSESPLALSGLVSVSVPLGYAHFSDDQWHPSAALLVDYQLSESWAINSNIGYTFNADGAPDQFMFTFTPGFAIGESAYGGYFGYAAFLSEQFDQHFIEAGFTRLVGDGVQLDINGGIDVSSGYFFLGAGFAHRF